MIIKMLLAFALGFVIACTIIYAIQLREHRKRKIKRKKVTLDTYAKVAVTAVILHGMILTTCSYILASMGMDPVVDVSSTIVKEIVAPIIVYLTTNMIMNIFEKNKLSFSVPLNSTIVTKDGIQTSSDDVEG